MSSFRILLKNSLANVASGAANALLAIVLPPFLVRHLAADVFSTWAVVLQIAAIVNVFNFGVQVAIGRYVAHCTASGNLRLRDQIISTAYAAMWISAVLALLSLVVVCFALPWLLPRMPGSMLAPARTALLLIGASLAIALPASVGAGLFSGFQRNEVPAIVIIATRCAIAVALIAIATHSASLVQMAAAYALINIAGSFAQFALAKRIYPALSFRRANVSRNAFRELGSYCFSIAVWSLGMLVIGGLDSVMAGYLAFRAAGYFAVAASVVAVVVGVQAALLQPLVAISAAMQGSSEELRLGEILVLATRTSTLVCAALIAPFYAYGAALLGLWVGDSFGREVLPIVQVLLFGIFIRQTLAPFATILLGTGEQRLVVVTVYYEAATKIVSSILLGLWLGPIGVAWGTVTGAVVCVVSNRIVNFPKVRGFSIRPTQFIGRGIFEPVLVFVPLGIVAVADALSDHATPTPWRLIASAIALCGMALVAYPTLRRLKALMQ